MVNGLAAIARLDRPRLWTVVGKPPACETKVETPRAANARTKDTAMKPKAKPLPATIKVHVPIDFANRGGRKLIIGEVPPLGTRPRIDNALVKAIARAYRW
jgi:hypothetical protein